LPFSGLQPGGFRVAGDRFHDQAVTEGRPSEHRVDGLGRPLVARRDEVRVGPQREARVRLTEVVGQLCDRDRTGQERRGVEVTERMHPVRATPVLDPGCPERSVPDDLDEQVPGVQPATFPGHQQPRRHRLSVRALPGQRHGYGREPVLVVVDLGQHGGGQRDGAFLAALE
jgi:hypothetical protein